MSTDVTLTDDEQRIVRWLAKRRIEESRKMNAKATIYHDVDPLENEVQAFGAEFAYCKMFNLWPTMVPTKCEPFDAHLRDGSSVDVKHSVRRDARLLVKVKDRKGNPVYYALMVGSFPTYTLIQHCRSDDVLVSERIDHTLKHPAYAVRQGESVAEVPINDVVFDKPPKQQNLW
jgi:hypothetical protein